MSDSRTPVLILGSLLAGVGGGFAGQFFATKPPRESVPPIADSRVDQLLAEHDRLTSVIKTLEQRLASREGESAPARIETATVSKEQVAEAVAAYFASQGKNAANLAAATTDAAAMAKATIELDEAWALLAAGGREGDYEARREIWKKLQAAGKLDQMVARFEQAAKDRPTDPDAHTALGGAYLEKLFTVGGGPEAGVWGMKADKSFDSALALNSEHWDARFAKATSLSFWPPVLGKQPEAIKHFEILRKQQEGSGVVKANYAQTYVFLGNLYDQNKDPEKAADARRTGARLFPDRPEFKVDPKR